jgi:tryptophan synthase beta chain
VEYTAVSDTEAMDAFHLLASTEGILMALETAHAVAEVTKHAPQLSPERIVVVNLSGRGDKDVESVIAFEEERQSAAGYSSEDRPHPAATWKRIEWGDRR